MAPGGASSMANPPLRISPIAVSQLTIGGFFQAALEPLGLALEAGRTGLERPILEPVLHRPGLALTGYYEFFAWRRPQVLGRAEAAYLRMLGPSEGLARWAALLQRDVPCVILCGRDEEPVGGDYLALADRLGIPVMVTQQETLEVFRLGSVLLHELTAPRVSIIGTLVDVDGVGVLLEGPPGIGKSETALGLMRRGHALIADDMTLLSVDAHGGVRGTSNDRFRGYMEIRGLGLLPVEQLFGIAAVKAECRLDLIVSLRRCETEDDIDRVGSDVQTCDVLGQSIQRMTIPVAAGRDFVNVVETAAATFKLRRSGIDPSATLDKQMISHFLQVEQTK